MKRIVVIAFVIVVLVGACTVTLLYNKKNIDAKARMDGNLQRIPVFIEVAGLSRISGNFESNGSFSAIHELTLMSEGNGKVVDLRFNTGDMVQEGKVLAILDDELIRSQLSLAEAALVKSKADLKKYESLLANDAISTQQVEDARLGLKKAETDVTALRKQLDYTSIKSPIPGTVTKRFIEKGSLVMPGTPVAEIVDVSRLKFIANVAESEVVQITPGQKVVLTASLFPGIDYRGTVVSVGVKADDARRFPVEIELFNDPKHPLKAGMFGMALFSFSSEREALMIPRHAIVGSIKEPNVYIIEGEKAVLRGIRIGKATDQQVEVLDGLKPGEVIVISGQINLDNNALVTIVNKTK
jgi:membrane fusion protein (multidrug efflux system)